MAATVTYRLAPKFPFPAAVLDVKSAVRWLRANAGKYKIDPKQIGGDGRLGWRASGAAVSGGDRGRRAQFDKGGQPRSIERAVQCVVNFFGPSDLTRFVWEKC